MVYAVQLREIGNTFMRSRLGYHLGRGNGCQSSWNREGPFIAVHMRRRDYVQVRPGMVPSLEGVANQINRLKLELGLEKVFVATDATIEGMCFWNRKALFRRRGGGVKGGIQPLLLKFGPLNIQVPYQYYKVEFSVVTSHSQILLTFTFSLRRALRPLACKV